MNVFCQRAEELTDQLQTWRRDLHQIPELNSELPQTIAYVTGRLAELGIPYKILGSGGITAQIGKAGGKVFLLRADMDALPLRECSGEPFSSQNGNMHACGHDIHTTMLMGCCRLLKEREGELDGLVKVLFQCDEEGMAGAKACLAAGLLRGPEVDAAMALHVLPGRMVAGSFSAHVGSTTAAVDRFSITVKGRGSHGALPHQGIDPVNVMMHIYLELQTIIAREIDTYEAIVMTVGSLHAGQNYNVIPDKAIMEGSIRSMNPDVSAYTRERIREIACKTAAAFRAECEVNIESNPACVNDAGLTKEIIQYAEESGLTYVETKPQMVSEDFAAIGECVPSCFVWIGAGGSGERYEGGALHDPAVRFNEDVLPKGACALAHCAYSWLKKHCR